MKQLIIRKRYLVGAAFLGLVGTMLGCTAQGADEDVSVDYGEDTLTEANNAGQLRLAADRVLALKLPARLSTGQSWTVDSIDNNVLKVAEDAVEADQVLGGTDTQIVRLVGVGAGTTELKLKYGHPWEETPQKTYSVKIDVAGAYTGNFQPAPKVASAPVDVGEPVVGLPGHYFSCDHGLCTPVKDQGQCGSCWAFATAGVVESAIALKDRASRDVSEQYLISCNNDGMGCQGGWASFDYFRNGVVYERDFSYTASDAACGGSYPRHEKMLGKKDVPNNVNAIKQAIMDHGGVWTTVCANSSFVNYKGGVFSGSCNPNEVNHAVVLTGWDDTGGYWIVRNSWGTWWGGDGYINMKYGANRIGENASTVEYNGSGGGGDSSCPVKLFADANYSGSSTCLDVGRFDISKLRATIGNDAVSSVKVKSGFKATLYAARAFQGSRKVVTGDTAFLSDFNDQASSVVVERR